MKKISSLIIVFILIIYTNSYSQQMVMTSGRTLEKYKTTVYFKDAKVDTIISPIYFSFDKTFIKAKNNKIYPNDTDSLLIKNYLGYPKENYWAFKNSTNKNNLITYSNYPNDLNLFISKPGEKIYKYSAKNIENLVSDNPKAYKYILESKKMSTISKSLLFGGFGVTTIGLMISAKDGNVNGFVIGGITMSITSWIPYLTSKEKIKDSVIEYNR